MPVEIQADDLAIDLDAARLCTELAKTMAEFYAARLLAGEGPDGSPLPRNQQGQPLGRGDGTIADNWEIGETRGNASSARSTTAPYQDGGYFYAVRSRNNKGFPWVSDEGKAAEKITDVIESHADSAIK